MGCSEPPAGDVLTATEPTLGISTHPWTPQVRPRSEPSAARSVGCFENFRQVRRARRTRENSEPAFGQSSITFLALRERLLCGGFGWIRARRCEKSNDLCDSTSNS